MKKLENKETQIINVDAKGASMGNCLYSNLLNLVIQQGKQGGFDYTDIENRLAISKVIKESTVSNGTMEFEDANFNYLKKLVETMRWNFFHEDLIKLKEDILNVK